jgi:hypothetical protein
MLTENPRNGKSKCRLPMRAVTKQAEDPEPSRPDNVPPA